MNRRDLFAVTACLMASALILGQGRGENPAARQTAAPPTETVAPDIPGVVKGGTRVQLLKGGFNGAEAVIAMPDGSVLFGEYESNRIHRFDSNDNFSLYAEDANRAAGLAYDHNGRLIATESRGKTQVEVLKPTRMVLADSFEGQPLVRPNDLVVDRKNGIYFTDPLPAPGRAFFPPPPGRKPLLFYITSEGRLLKVSEDIKSPNGVQLSPDEKTLYATDAGRIVAFDVQPDGTLRNPRTFVESGGDGLAIDNAGPLYASTGQSVRIFSARGEDLGAIPVGITPAQSVGFAGKMLYIVGGGLVPNHSAVYKLPMIAQGIMSRAK